MAGLLFLRNSLRHTDGACRTDESAEVTAYAFGAYQAGATGLSVEDDSLMAAVAARHLTTSAADAQLLVEFRIDDGITIQVVRLHE